MAPILTTQQVTKRFGGLTAVSRLDVAIEEQLDSQHHRSERRGQDDVLQLYHRLLPA